MIKYVFPDDPFLKFRSDLNRELTAKHFPIWSFHKYERKFFKSPLAILNEGHIGNSSNYITLKYADENGLFIINVGTGAAYGYVESEGECEEHFTNTNPRIPSEGYNTKQTFIYQGPTWKVYTLADAKGDYEKTGVTRQQLADAIIECVKAACPSRDFDNEWDELIVEIDEAIKNKQKYINETLASLDIGKYGDDADIEKLMQSRVRSAERQVEELNKALEEPALSSEYIN